MNKKHEDKLSESERARYSKFSIPQLQRCKANLAKKIRAEEARLYKCRKLDQEITLLSSQLDKLMAAKRPYEKEEIVDHRLD
jgi:primosomal protein N''